MYIHLLSEFQTEKVLKVTKEIFNAVDDINSKNIWTETFVTPVRQFGNWLWVFLQHCILKWNASVGKWQSSSTRCVVISSPSIGYVLSWQIKLNLSLCLQDQNLSMQQPYFLMSKVYKAVILIQPTRSCASKEHLWAVGLGLYFPLHGGVALYSFSLAKFF